MKKYNNNDFSIKDIDKEVTLYGWASKKRNLGGIIFIDLRDRSGIIQLVINPDNPNYDLALQIKNEYVLEITGVIKKREHSNPNLKTGEVEVLVSSLTILNKSEELPFEISDDITALEDTRLKYRYLDLRRNQLKNNLIMRHKIVTEIRNYLNNLDFLEIETPILCKSTPEGARDYLVPSRINKGSFYALPQSPQLFKQLLMVSGMEKYYQIARCFRDEDLRADRQPEFTQIDIEMSFVTEEDIFKLVEGMFKQLFKNIKNIDLPNVFPRIKYVDAINMYGSDKPDTRFEMLINDLTSIFKNTNFTPFQKEEVNCIVVKNKADFYSRKKIDELLEFIKIYDADNLFWLKYSDQISSSFYKNLSVEEQNSLIKNLSLEENDLVLIVSGKRKIVKTALGALRLKIAKEIDIIDKDKYNFLWVTDFPMFEYSEKENRYIACHHPFTMPNDVNMLDDKENCYARAYDIVLNGYELASGSIRIHDPKIQQIVFEKLGISKEEQEAKFGFLLEAFKYGVPPHAGIAPGLERLTMLMCNTDNIRDVVAFPKTASAYDLLTKAPSTVSENQLKDLGIEVIK